MAQLIEPNTKILEDGDEALFAQGETPDEAVEYVDLTKDAAAVVGDARIKPAAAQGDSAADKASVNEIPDQFKGKTQAQIVKMYQDAQSTIGRQGHELGDLRRLADSYIKAGLAARTGIPAVPAKKPIEDVDIFAKPKDAIADMISNHPEIKALKGAAKAMAEERTVDRALRNQSAFNTEYPDAAETLQDPKFQEWIGKSKVRQNMLLAAHQKYDLEAGREVFGTWKDLQGAGRPGAPAQAGAAAAAAAKAKALRTASVPTGGNASPTDAKNAGKKIYKRADVIRLMEEDPERYDALVGEIQQAYQEGRVR